ncbi:unnamed protein product, partial [Iphiclides podalirius]
MGWPVRGPLASCGYPKAPHAKEKRGPRNYTAGRSGARDELERGAGINVACPVDSACFAGRRGPPVNGAWGHAARESAPFTVAPGA